MAREKSRRAILVGSCVAIAGCTSEGDDDIQDSDGDGVIDSEDYAPNDPDVQEKSDLQSNTDTITPSPTDQPATKSTETPTRTPAATETPTPTESPTPTSTPSPTPTPTSLVVDDEYWTDQSRITEYRYDQVSVRVDPDYPEPNHDSSRLYAGLWEFPRGDTVDAQLSEEFSQSDGPLDLTIEFDLGSLDSSSTYHIFTALVPGDVSSLDEIEWRDVTTIMETDPFKVQGDGRSIYRTEYASSISDDSGQNYQRDAIEGAYRLQFEGRTLGEDWSIYFFAWKSAHAEAVNRSRGRSRPEYVQYELTDGTGKELANLLKDEAEALGYTGREAIEFVIDWVQSLPYVPDDVSTGFDDYTKFIMETMCDMGGDCEDTSILLASILQAEAFNYDMVLIQPPGHMAAGIWQSDPEGYYWEYDGRKYSYIETTGQGWGIGDLPEDYQGERATVHQV